MPHGSTNQELQWTLGAGLLECQQSRTPVFTAGGSCSGADTRSQGSVSEAGGQDRRPDVRGTKHEHRDWCDDCGPSSSPVPFTEVLAQV